MKVKGREVLLTEERRSKRTRTRQDEEESIKVGLSWENALCRSRLIVVVDHIPSVVEDTGPLVSHALCVF